MRSVCIERTVFSKYYLPWEELLEQHTLEGRVKEKSKKRKSFISILKFLTEYEEENARQRKKNKQQPNKRNGLNPTDWIQIIVSEVVQVSGVVQVIEITECLRQNK